MDRSTIEASRRYHARRDGERLRARETRRREWLQRVRSAVRRLAPAFPGVRTVHAYGSLVKPGRFTAGSDLDLAVDCEDLEEEGRFWRALEEALGRDVDIRPHGPIAQVVELRGERIYEREAPAPGADHRGRSGAD